MEKRKYISWFINICLVIIVVVITSHNHGYYKGFMVGSDKMFTATMDTIQTILNNQANSDTTKTVLIIENQDTIVYFLSRKTINIK